MALDKSITQKASSLVKVGIGEGGSPNNTDNQGSYTGSGPPGDSWLLGGPNFKASREEDRLDVVGGGCGPSLPQIKAAWGDFMDEIGKQIGGWEWFATFTFRDPENPNYPGWTKPGWKYAHRALWDWNDALLSATMGKLCIPYWIACMEYQHWRGVPHWHLLVANTANERRMDWVDWWYAHYGIARILPYQEKLGARYYLGKYLVKELADVVVAPRLRLLRKQPCP